MSFELKNPKIHSRGATSSFRLTSADIKWWFLISFTFSLIINLILATFSIIFSWGIGFWISITILDLLVFLITFIVIKNSKVKGFSKEYLSRIKKINYNQTQKNIKMKAPEVNIIPESLNQNENLSVESHRFDESVHVGNIASSSYPYMSILELTGFSFNNLDESTLTNKMEIIQESLEKIPLSFSFMFQKKSTNFNHLYNVYKDDLQNDLWKEFEKWRDKDYQNINWPKINDINLSYNFFNNQPTIDFKPKIFVNHFDKDKTSAYEKDFPRRPEWKVNYTIDKMRDAFPKVVSPGLDNIYSTKPYLLFRANKLEHLLQYKQEIISLLKSIEIEPKFVNKNQFVKVMSEGIFGTSDKFSQIENIEYLENATKITFQDFQNNEFVKKEEFFKVFTFYSMIPDQNLDRLWLKNELEQSNENLQVLLNVSHLSDFMLRKAIGEQSSNLKSLAKDGKSKELEDGLEKLEELEESLEKKESFKEISFVFVLRRDSLEELEQIYDTIKNTYERNYNFLVYDFHYEQKEAFEKLISLDLTSFPHHLINGDTFAWGFPFTNINAVQDLRGLPLGYSLVDGSPWAVDFNAYPSMDGISHPLYKKMKMNLPYSSAHSMTTGKSGSGKSTFAKTQFYQYAVLQKETALCIDIDGELSYLVNLYKNMGDTRFQEISFDKSSPNFNPISPIIPGALEEMDEYRKYTNLIKKIETSLNPNYSELNVIKSKRLKTLQSMQETIPSSIKGQLMEFLEILFPDMEGEPKERFRDLISKTVEKIYTPDRLQISIEKGIWPKISFFMETLVEIAANNVDLSEFKQNIEEKETKEQRENKIKEFIKSEYGTLYWNIIYAFRTSKGEYYHFFDTDKPLTFNNETKIITFNMLKVLTLPPKVKFSIWWTILTNIFSLLQMGKFVFERAIFFFDEFHQVTRVNDSSKLDLKLSNVLANLIDQLIRRGRKFGFRLAIATQGLNDVMVNDKLRETFKTNVTFVASSNKDASSISTYLDINPQDPNSLENKDISAQKLYHTITKGMAQLSKSEPSTQGIFTFWIKKEEGFQFDVIKAIHPPLTRLWSGVEFDSIYGMKGNEPRHEIGKYLNYNPYSKWNSLENLVFLFNCIMLEKFDQFELRDYGDNLDIKFQEYQTKVQQEL